MKINRFEKLILESLDNDLPKLNEKLLKYYPFAEWVPVEYLDTVKEYDRIDNFGSWEYKTLDDLYKDIVKNGVTYPIMLYYSIPDNRVIISEGNHRLAVAKQNGWTHFPTIVTRTHQNLSDEHRSKSKMVDAYDRGKYGDHIPSEFRPSKLGIPSKIIYQ